MPRSFLIARKRLENEDKDNVVDVLDDLCNDPTFDEDESDSDAPLVVEDGAGDQDEHHAVKEVSDERRSDAYFDDLAQLADVSLAAEGRLRADHPLSEAVRRARESTSSKLMSTQTMQLTIPSNTSHIIICTTSSDSSDLSKVREEQRSREESKTLRSLAVLHRCGECGKSYSTSSNLARHKQTHRSIDDHKAKRCGVCGKIYVSMPAFSMHMRTHNQTCVCHICNKAFSRPWLLQGHLRTHTGERPYACDVCNKTFADRSNLRAHVQTHSSRKPFVCGRCGKTFALKSYLCKHEETVCNTTNDS